MVVPEGWNQVELGERARVTSGGTPKVDRKDYYGGIIPFARIEDVTSCQRLVINDTVQSITQKAIEETSAKVYPTGTVLVTMYGTIGRVAITGREMAANQAIAAFLELDAIDPPFLAYLLANDAPKLAKKAGQTTQANISGRILKLHRVAMPPIAEQKKIAEILGGVDEAIQATQAVIDQTRKVKQGLLQQLLTRGIGHTRFKQTEIGEIPESWEVATVEEILEPRKGALCYGILQPGNDVEGGVPMLRTVDLSVHGRLAGTDILRVDRAIEAEYGRTRLRGGEVLLSVMGTVGRTIVVQDAWIGWNVNRALAVVRADRERVTPVFLYAWLRSPTIQKKFGDEMIGSAQQRINLGAFCKFQLPVPPLAEQVAIAERFAEAEQAYFLEERVLTGLQRMKTGLMSDLLSGRVRVQVDA